MMSAVEGAELDIVWRRFRSQNRQRGGPITTLPAPSGVVIQDASTGRTRRRWKPPEAACSNYSTSTPKQACIMQAARPGVSDRSERLIASAGFTFVVKYDNTGGG